MSEFELWQLYDTFQRTVTDQFQFWMAATFAVVIASYTAGHRLSVWARSAIAVIYAVAATLFFVRYMGASDFPGEIAQQLREVGGELTVPSGLLPSRLRRIVMIGGSLLAVILICVPTIADRRTSGDST